MTGNGGAHGAHRVLSESNFTANAPGMANHLVIVCEAVVRTWSSGTSWSTSPTFRASAGL